MLKIGDWNRFKRIYQMMEENLNTAPKMKEIKFGKTRDPIYKKFMRVYTKEPVYLKDIEFGDKYERINGDTFRFKGAANFNMHLWHTPYTYSPSDE